MSCPEKTEIPPLQAPLPPPEYGFIPPNFETPKIPPLQPPPPPYAPTVIIRDVNHCVICQRGTYELQWNGWMVFLIVFMVLIFFPLGLLALLCLPAARQNRCSNCYAKKPNVIVVQQV